MVSDEKRERKGEVGQYNGLLKARVSKQWDKKGKELSNAMLLKEKHKLFDPTFIINLDRG